jgi:hypothetical protein
MSAWYCILEFFTFEVHVHSVIFFFFHDHLIISSSIFITIVCHSRPQQASNTQTLHPLFGAVWLHTTSLQQSASAILKKDAVSFIYFFSLLGPLKERTQVILIVHFGR